MVCAVRGPSNRRGVQCLSGGRHPSCRAAAKGNLGSGCGEDGRLLPRPERATFSGIEKTQDCPPRLQAYPPARHVRPGAPLFIRTAQTMAQRILSGTTGWEPFADLGRGVPEDVRESWGLLMGWSGTVPPSLKQPPAAPGTAWGTHVMTTFPDGKRMPEEGF
jgi:hypothetical protein